MLLAANERFSTCHYYDVPHSILPMSQSRSTVALSVSPRIVVHRHFIGIEVISIPLLGFAIRQPGSILLLVEGLQNEAGVVRYIRSIIGSDIMYTMSLLVTIIVRWKDRWASIFALLNSQNTAAMSLTTVAIVGRLKQEPKWRSRLLNVKIDGPAFFRHRKQPTL